MTPVEIITLAGVGVSLILGVVNAIPQIRKSKTDYNTTNIESIDKLSEQVNELIEDKIRMNQRIDELEKDVRKFRNAYAKAIVYIHEKLPLEEIPNFLDTDPRIKSAKRMQ